MPHAPGESGRRRSPTGLSASASAAPMRGFLALQRSRSLRDPSTRRSVDSASNNNNRAATDPDAAETPHRGGGGALKTLVDQLAEDQPKQHKLARRPRCRFKSGATRRAAAIGTGDRTAVSVKSHGTNYRFEKIVWAESELPGGAAPF